jgi:hypothetical protein
MKKRWGFFWVLILGTALAAAAQTHKVVVVKGGVQKAAGKIQAPIVPKAFSPAARVKPRFFSSTEKKAILKEANVSEVMALPGEGLKVTLKAPNFSDQLYITLNQPRFVSSQFYGTGVASFDNSESFYRADGADKAFKLDFSIEAGKWYLIDCPVSETDATYRVLVYQSSGPSQITFDNPADGHLLIVYQATVSGQAYIAITGNCPRQGNWGIYGAEITVIH